MLRFLRGLYRFIASWCALLVFAILTDGTFGNFTCEARGTFPNGVTMEWAVYAYDMVMDAVHNIVTSTAELSVP